MQGGFSEFLPRKARRQDKCVLSLVLGALLLVVAFASCASQGETEPTATEARWHPGPGLSWQWQLSGRVDTSFDVVEECFAYQECGKYSPFVEAEKAVFLAEYDTRNTSSRCEKAHRLNFTLIFKHLDLGHWRRTC